MTRGRAMPFLPCALQRHLMHVHEYNYIAAFLDQMPSEMPERWGRWRDSQRRCIRQYALLCNMKNATYISPTILFTLAFSSDVRRTAWEKRCTIWRRAATSDGYPYNASSIGTMHKGFIRVYLTIAWLQISMDNILAVKIDHSCDEQNWSVTLVTLQ